jgi:hypothetical protein
MKFEDTKGAIRRRKLEDRQYNGQKRDKTMVHKTLGYSHGSNTTVQLNERLNLITAARVLVFGGLLFNVSAIAGVFKTRTRL